MFINDGLVDDDDNVCDGGVFDHDDDRAQPFFDGGGELFSQQAEDNGDAHEQPEGDDKQPSQPVFQGQPKRQLSESEQRIPRQTKKSTSRKKFYTSCGLLFFALEKLGKETDLGEASLRICVQQI